MSGNKLHQAELGLGCITWGTDVDERSAHLQIDRFLDHGFGLIDTAELYPAYPKGLSTPGVSEVILGRWIKSTKRREKIRILTKISGFGFKCIRDGRSPSFDDLIAAVHGSLERLSTEYIDTACLHWPTRNTYHMRGTWSFDPTRNDMDEAKREIEQSVVAFGQLIQQGNILSYCLSNETSWGAMYACSFADANGLPRPVGIQNEYSLLNRSFDFDLSEMSVSEDLPLYGYAPLSAGLLTGKYAAKGKFHGRKRHSPNLSGRATEIAELAASKYVELASESGLQGSELAIAFVSSRPFVKAVVTSFSSCDQIEQASNSIKLKLNATQLERIEAIRRKYPIPF